MADNNEFNNENESEILKTTSKKVHNPKGTDKANKANKAKIEQEKKKDYTPESNEDLNKQEQSEQENIDSENEEDSLDENIDNENQSQETDEKKKESLTKNEDTEAEKENEDTEAEKENEDTEAEKAREDAETEEEDSVKNNDNLKSRPRKNAKSNAEDSGTDENGEKDNSDKENKTEKTEKVEDKLDSEDESTFLNKINENKTVKMLKNLSKTSGLLVRVLLNPITIGILIVALIIMLLSSAQAIIGRNDYNIMCSSDGIGVVQISSDADAFTRQSAIVAWLTSTPFEKLGNKPMTREQAIAVIGNIAKESYQGNPKAIQGDHSITQWQTCDNDCVGSWGAVGGKAVGIVQWDTSRRQQLISFAREEGLEWHDLNLQLKFLKKELDGYEGSNLVNGGFANLTNTIDDYVRIWNMKFERSAASGTPAGDNPRIEYALEFASRYTDGSGMAMNCIGGSVNTSNLIQLALSTAYSRAEALQGLGFGSCSAIGNCGQTFSKEEYKQANLIAYEKTGPDPSLGTLASCDRFVATMLRATGVDPTFPWGSTANQSDYLNSSPSWQKISCADRQPGDVIMWRPTDGSGYGHVMLYVGIVDGKDSLASASIAIARGGRSAQIRDVSCRGDLFNGDGVTAQGWRKIN